MNRHTRTSILNYWIQDYVSSPQTEEVVHEDWRDTSE